MKSLQITRLPGAWIESVSSWFGKVRDLRDIVAMMIANTRRTVLVATCCLILFCTAACRASEGPQLLTSADVAPDLAALADETWAQFTDAFAVRLDCVGDVRLQTTDDLAGRAAYNPSTATVTIEVPATAALLQEALVHEWAHHVEFHCAAHSDMRPDFLAAQSLPPGQDWFSASSWADTPSEQYAEAAILYVLGRRQLPTEINISPGAVDVLAAWASTK